MDRPGHLAHRAAFGEGEGLAEIGLLAGSLVIDPDGIEIESQVCFLQQGGKPGVCAQAVKPSAVP